MPALIFDCDGVLADTERDGHRPAFNQTFAEVGVPVRWSAQEYADKLRIGGGKERMGLPTEDAIVIEDSRNGLLAAVGAGLRCVVTVSSYTAEEDASEAVLVVSSLGDPGDPARVIARRVAVDPGELVTLADLDRCRTEPTTEEESV